MLLAPYNHITTAGGWRNRPIRLTGLLLNQMLIADLKWPLDMLEQSFHFSHSFSHFPVWLHYSMSFSHIKYLWGRNPIPPAPPLFFCIWISICLSTICGNYYLLPIELSCLPPVEYQLTVNVRFISRLSILLHWSTYQSLWHKHCVFIIVAL